MKCDEKLFGVRLSEIGMLQCAPCYFPLDQVVQFGWFNKAGVKLKVND